VSKGVQIAIAAASVAIALMWIMSSSEGTFQSFETVRELNEQLALQPESGDRRDLRVAGFVRECSIRKDLPGGKVWFTVRDPIPADAQEPALLPVLYPNIDLPDLFKDGAQVMVEGGFEGEQFVARRVMAKCPSKYENAVGADAQVPPPTNCDERIAASLQAAE
jgi:cytochrome c-type biogenesis protein CcmE